MLPLAVRGSGQKHSGFLNDGQFNLVMQGDFRSHCVILTWAPGFVYFFIYQGSTRGMGIGYLELEIVRSVRHPVSLSKALFAGKLI